MEKKEYVKPTMCVVELDSENIIATSAKFIGVSDEEAEYDMEVLSKGRTGGLSDEDNSWGSLW
ncbi:MAG: hypothetical protein NC252_03135 [Roseburia sp.]|nr:hypothetical protein [Roseburia sp.]